MKTLSIICVIIICIVIITNIQTTVCKNEIYIDRFVYLKKDSTLFSGKMIHKNSSSGYYVTFCNGIPCGKWAETQNGGTFIAKGEYLNPNEVFSESILDEFLNDTLLINYYYGGGDLPSDPLHFDLIILKDDRFFDKNDLNEKQTIYDLAKILEHDIESLEYDYFKISFRSSVFGAEKNLSKTF